MNVIYSLVTYILAAWKILDLVEALVGKLRARRAARKARETALPLETNDGGTAYVAPQMKDFRDLNLYNDDEKSGIEAHTIVVPFSNVTTDTTCTMCGHEHRCLPVGIDKAMVCANCTKVGTEQEQEQMRDNFNDFMDATVMKFVEDHIEAHHKVEDDPARSKAQYN